MMNGKIGEIHSFRYSDGWPAGRLQNVILRLTQFNCQLPAGTELGNINLFSDAE